jgi:hypothetical protein
LARSRTINFYNEFMEKNKELSSIICGVENSNDFSNADQLANTDKIEEEEEFQEC